jgi:hypothetical protein
MPFVLNLINATVCTLGGAAAGGRRLIVPGA